jgi:mannose-6-phosphate isomerase-like protein (cupin superfamily)
VRAARDVLRVPWFAIGGIGLGTVNELAAAGAPGVAVVRAIRDADDPEAAARALRAGLPSSDAIVGRPGWETGALLPQVELLEATAPSGEGVWPHTHRVHAEAFYVVTGELEFRLGGETVRVPPGSLVAAPPSLVHGFRNPGDDDAHYLNLHAPGVWARGRFFGEEPAHFDTFSADDGSRAARGRVSGPGDGDRIAEEHRLVLLKVSLPELDVFEFFVSAEFAGADPHLHLRHADCFYVLEGELEFRLGGRTVLAGAGASVVVPPGIVHAFTSVGRARFLNVHTPSCGFVEYVRRVGAGEQVDGAHYDVYDVSL